MLLKVEKTVEWTVQMLELETTLGNEQTLKSTMKNPHCGHLTFQLTHSVLLVPKKEGQTRGKNCYSQHINVAPKGFWQLSEE